MVGFVLACCAPKIPEITGTVYYIDCEKGANSNLGTSSSNARGSLDKINQITFQPGDGIFFKRGTTCDGALTPQGSRAEGQPIIMGAYESGELPIIDAGYRPEAAKPFYQKVVDAEERMTRWGGSSPLTYYAALSLQALDLPTFADEKFSALQDFAQQKLEAGSEADFFTSKPTMIVFDDDPQVANHIQGHYMMGLASLGMGKTLEAAISLKSVLNLDPLHWWAKFHLSSIS